ncbi:MAG: type I-MYXAN CRISPR-associated endonuclease Cas1 [Gammaproteobacteria bacterium]
MDIPSVRVMALHALAYCERLFYLEEVEEIRRADHRVYAGRTLHESLADKDGEWQEIELESETWGLKGKVDYVRYRDGELVAYEHKRGRSKGDEAWDSDRLQVIAYCALLSEHLGKPVTAGRIRYHTSHKTIAVRVDDAALAELKAAVERARSLAARLERPPVATNDAICAKCSLAPVCLPAEERFLQALDEESDHAKPQRLFPADEERRTLHVTEAGSEVRINGEQIVVLRADTEPAKFPARDVAAIVLHGSVQISSQTLHYAVAHDIGVHWLTGGGSYVGGLAPAGGVQRRLRQYQGLSDAALCLALARRLVKAKIENQLQFVLRSARNKDKLAAVEAIAQALRAELRAIDGADNPDSLRGHEGAAGRHYFSALPELLDESQPLMAFAGRNRRPPRDPFNAALSFGYSLLYREVMAAILCVGLDPALGFFHRPRSAAYPLALDLMELFRVWLWDMPLIASINRKQWTAEHFTRTPHQVWLSDEGRKQAIRIYEMRKQEQWRHPVLDYSLSYARSIELEVRLLEKEWSGSAGLFARMRIR